MNKTFSIVVATMLLLTAVHAQQKVPRPPSVKEQEEPGSTIRVNVKLVSVFTTVTDQRGAPIGGLERENFKIYEDGKPQQLAVFDRESGLPLSIVLGIDASLSTRKDLPLELESARRFAHAILRPIDAMSVMQFSEIVDEIQGFTSDITKVDRGISSVRTGSATALYDAVYLGSESLSRRKGRKVMVIITDGGDTSSRSSYAESLRAAQISEAIIYPIIMVPIEASAGRDLGGEHALIQMATDTGGKYYYAKSLKQLDGAFKQISEELRTQYLLGYYPPKTASSDYRQIHIEITATPPPGIEFKVRARNGYYTSKID